MTDTHQDDIKNQEPTDEQIRNRIRQVCGKIRDNPGLKSITHMTELKSIQNKCKQMGKSALFDSEYQQHEAAIHNRAVTA